MIRLKKIRRKKSIFLKENINFVTIEVIFPLMYSSDGFPTLAIFTNKNNTFAGKPNIHEKGHQTHKVGSHTIVFFML